MNTFWKTLSRIIFWVAGWKLEGSMPKNVKKAVMIAAPHTSNWDFLYCRAAFFLLDVPMKYTIKKEVMIGPLGWLLSSLGAISIDRKAKGSKQTNMVDHIVNIFEERQELIILVTPEGTRKYAKKWKSGFYHIAQKAKVPMILGYLDYKRKIAGVGNLVYATGNYQKDLVDIQAFFKDKTARFPNQGVR